MRGKTKKVILGRTLLTLLVLITIIATSGVLVPGTVQAAPAPPANLTAVYNSTTGRINLTWTDNSNNEVGFHIETATNAGFLSSLTFQTAANATTYSDGSVYAGDTFYYRVTSFDNTGDSAPSNVVSVFIPLLPPSVPAAPSNLAGIIVSNTQVNLTWVDNSVDEVGFLLERADDPGFTQNPFSYDVGANLTTQADIGVVNGSTYYYRLSAYNALGSSNYSNILVISIVVPPAPGGLTAVAASQTQVNLSWTDNSNSESGFIIQRAPTAAFTSPVVINVGANITAYNDSSVAASTSYYYRVIAINALGNSAPSTPANVTTPASPVVPASPSGLNATVVSSTRVDLTWTDNSNNETEFVIQRATNTGFTSGLTSVPAPVNAIAYSDTSATPATTYYYRVYANNAVGPSGYSNVVIVTTLPVVPAAPSSLSATVIAANQVNLSWVDNAGNETGFKVQRADNSAFTSGFVEFDIPSSNATSYSDSPVTVDTTYYYRVLAYNASGNSQPSNVFNVTTNISIPNTPSNLTGVLVNPNRLDVSWTDTSVNESGFYLDTALNSTFTQGRVIITLPANTTNYSDLSVYGGDVFYYRISAFNSLGTSPVSSIFSYTIPPGTPDVIFGPTNLAAVALHGHQVNLSWVDNSNNEVGFLVERAQDNLFTLNPDSFIAPVNEIPGATVLLTDDTAVPFTTYYYRVRAYNATGVSIESNIVNVTTPAALPFAPAGLTGSVTGLNTINLTWMDSSNDETGFRVERATNAAFTAGLTPYTVLANVTVYDNINVIPGTTYYYRVYAFNTVGDSIEPSNTFIITAGLPAAPIGLAAVSINPAQVNLTWTDNANNENSYRVERATAADFSAGFVSFNAPANSVSFSDISVAANTTYYYRIFAVNGAGDSAPSNTANLTNLDVLPSGPTSLAAVAAGAGQVDLTWTDNAGNETGYLIERAANANFTGTINTFNAPVDAVAYSDITTVPITTYYYRVMAFNGTGNSVPSNTASVTTPAADPAQLPAAPTGLTAVMVNDNRIDLIWTDNALNETEYHLSTALDAAFSVGLVTITLPAGATSYTDLSVYAGDTFFYQVRAFNNMGGSLPSNTVSVTIPLSQPNAPTAPSGLTATVISVNQVDLSWADNSNNEVGFLLERALDNQFTQSPATFNLAPDVTAFTDDTVFPANTYYYRIIAYNVLGNSAASNTATVTTSEVVPAAPSGLTANAISAVQVNLSWADNSGNETQFKVQRDTTTAFAAPTTVLVNANITSYSDISVAASTTYYYRVLATNTVGDSLPSNVVSVTTPTAAAPSAPSGLGAVVVAANRVDLSWTDNANNETGFRVERATNSTFTQNLSAFDVPTTNATSFINVSTVANTIYFYRVFAYNAGGDSAASNTVSVNTTVPAVPSNLTATLFSASRVNLTWTDNSNNETGFRIDRATDPAFNVGIVSFPLPLNTVTYGDTTAILGNTYYYRVVALNSNGSSAPSNVINILVAAPTASGNLNAALFSQTAVNLTWADNSANEDGFQIDRATNNTFTAGLVSAFASAGATFYRDSGLLPDAQYYYRVIAYNAVGDAPPSNVASILTTLPLLTVTTTAASNVTSVAATLNGNLTSYPGATVNVSFQWGTASGNYTAETTPQPRNAVGVFSANLNFLNPNITYFYRSKAVGLNTVFGTEMSFTTPPAATDAPIYLNPSIVGPLTVGQTFNLEIRTSVAAGQSVSGVAAFLNFDPSKLEVVDANGPTAGIQITPGVALPVVVSNTANNTNGTINFNAGQLGTPYPTGDFLVATIQFRTLAVTTPDTNIAFSFISPQQTIVEFGGTALSGTHGNAAVTIAAGTTVDISVGLQGGSRPASGWVIPLTVKFFTPGTNVLTGTPVYSFNLATTQSGSFAVAQCTGVAAGTYDITAVSEHTLTNVKRNVLATIPGISVDLGILLEGDANNDGVIDILDFGILSFAYGTQVQDAAYNALADFDRNGTIDILDFGLLSVNYTRVSPVEIP